MLAYVSRKPGDEGGHPAPYGQQLDGFFFSFKVLLLTLVLPSGCGPCCSRRLGDPSAGGPSPRRTGLLLPPSTEVPAGRGTPVSASRPGPLPASAEVQTLPSVCHFHLSSSKHFLPFLTAAGKKIPPKVSSCKSPEFVTMLSYVEKGNLQM